MKKIREKINILTVKNPGHVILAAILFLNIVLFLVSAAVISRLAPPSLEQAGFWQSVYYTVCMVLDAGCISNVISDIGQASVGLIVACILIVIIGMISFTGAVIGYVTNSISSFIDSSNSGSRRLKISGHTVILNWNSRAAEIINDMLYSGRKEIIVVLVDTNAEQVQREIDDCISDTLRREHVRGRLTVIVRQGDTFSTKMLHDISVMDAKNVIILCKSAAETYPPERAEPLERGNTNTLMTLVQVAELTASESSADEQTIVVEVEDNWTERIIERIIYHKERLEKCNIVTVPVYKIQGQLLSQFSIMPELNVIYRTLFSNKGPEFFSRPHPNEWNEDLKIHGYLNSHSRAIVLTAMETKTGRELFYVADDERDFTAADNCEREPVAVKLKADYSMERKNVIILGHNSKLRDIMLGFDAFRAEWNRDDGDEILNLLVIDDRRSLEKLGHYRSCPYVSKVVEAELFESELIVGAIDAFVDANAGDTSVLILSDDKADPEDLDSNALTYLIYVQDIISRRLDKNPDFDIKKIDVVVEILNPKNYDVFHDFSAENIVISNRYISKLLTQLSEKAALYNFYRDILSYDPADALSPTSKEVYIKPVKAYLAEYPKSCTAAQLIRALYAASPEGNRAILLGYVKASGKIVLFTGKRQEEKVELTGKDKLIVFCTH